MKKVICLILASVLIPMALNCPFAASWLEQKYGQEWWISPENDFSYGEFNIHMSVDNAAKHYPSAPLSDVTSEIAAGDYQRIVTFDTLVLTFVSSGSPFGLYSIESTDPSLITPRGLRVGDDVIKVLELYRTPKYIENNVWVFGDGGYEYFKVTVKCGTVQKIRVNCVM